MFAQPRWYMCVSRSPTAIVQQNSQIWRRILRRRPIDDAGRVFDPGHVQDVLIVGAGPTGLTLACELRRFDIPCRIIDKRSVHVDRSRAADVQSRSLEVFDGLGILPKILEEGRRLTAMSIYDSPRKLARLSLSANDAPYPFTVALPQSRTEELLEEKLEQLGGQVERGTRLDRLTSHADCVDIELTLGNNKTERSRIAWVVGCDGVSSAVRQHAGIDFDIKGRAQSFAAADATLDWHLPTDEISLFISSEGFLLLLPLPGELRMRVLADTSVPGRRPQDLDGLSALASLHAGSPVHLHSPKFVSTYHVQRRLASRFQHNRVLLAGDAAHSFNPVGGHGMNQGIQDAHNLGWKLAMVVLDESPEELVATYAGERRNAARDFVRELDFEARLRLSRMDTAPDDHERLMDFAVGAPPLRRSVLDAALQQQQIYSIGPFVSEHLASGFDVSGGLSAGSPLPAVSDSEPNLSRIRNATRPSVLLFTGTGRVPPSVTGLADDLDHRFGALVDVYVVTQNGDVGRDEKTLHDTNGSMHTRFGALLPCAYVLRPDNYVAYRCCPLMPKQLRSFLDGLLSRR